MKQFDFEFCGSRFIADPSGGLIWPNQKLAVVSDLHLGKSRAIAKHTNQFLPPYDTTATLSKLVLLLENFEVRKILSLGDSFHHHNVGLLASDIKVLKRLTLNYEWLWIIGNHDPSLPHRLKGRYLDEVSIDNITFRHRASLAPKNPEVSGHFHPVVYVRLAGRRIKGRCFIHDKERLILPAFGSYTGGLNVINKEVASLFLAQKKIYICGKKQVYEVPTTNLI